MSGDIKIFDRRVKKLHRDRSASLLPNHDFLIQESANRIAEQFDGTITRQFPVMLDLGCRLAQLSAQLQHRAGIKTIIKSDFSFNILTHNDGLRVNMDEEYLAFAPESIDLVASVLNLHWVNDLPGCLIQIQKALTSQGLFIASLLGGKTLHELRHVIIQSEAMHKAGSSPRISPFTEVKDAGSLLQRAGFALPVTDSEIITVMYKDAFSLMHDLRAMGETNALVKRSKYFTTRSTMQTIAETYAELYADNNGHIPATFEIITLTGWKN